MVEFRTRLKDSKDKSILESVGTTWKCLGLRSREDETEILGSQPLTF